MGFHTVSEAAAGLGHPVAALSGTPEQPLLEHRDTGTVRVAMAGPRHVLTGADLRWLPRPTGDPRRA
jgi:hypothetical protein